jgi:hypothetical protein
MQSLQEAAAYDSSRAAADQIVFEATPTTFGFDRLQTREKTFNRSVPLKLAPLMSRQNERRGIRYATVLIILYCNMVSSTHALDFMNRTSA